MLVKVTYSTAVTVDVADILSNLEQVKSYIKLPRRGE